MRKKKDKKKLFGTYFQVMEDSRKEAYKFPSPKAENEYRDICISIWGAVPHEIFWAMGSILYKDELQKRKFPSPYASVH